MINCLQWGIEDGVGERHLINYEAGKLIFAVIGPVTYIKGQDFLIDTLNKCSKKITDNIEVMIIGDISEELKKEFAEYMKNEKGIKVRQLFSEVDFPPTMTQFFDLDSDELLDEKIRVLTALKDGKQIADIPNFYAILELYPKDGEHWD